MLSSFEPYGDECSICGYDLGGSHYHCGRCGKVGSYQGCYGSKDGKTWEFSCKPEDVEKWEERKKELNKQYTDTDIEISTYVGAYTLVQELINNLTDQQLYGVIEDIVDSMDSSVVEEVYEMLKALHDRWVELDAR